MRRFYKANGKVGSSVLFWAIDGRGYTSDIDNAEIFTKEEAREDIDRGGLRSDDEFYLNVYQVDKLSEWRIDSQYVEKAYPAFKDPSDEYLSFAARKRDGNDLYFLSAGGDKCDYRNAGVLSEEGIKPHLDDSRIRFIPKCHADELARRTFQSSNIDALTLFNGGQ